MKFRNPYWSPKTKLQLLERWILIHSIIYYRLNTSIVSDVMYDNNCNQLVKGIKKFPEAFKQTKYYYAFKGFTGETGFDLYSKLNTEDREKLEQQAEYLVLMCKRRLNSG